MRAVFRQTAAALLLLASASPAFAGDWDLSSVRLLSDPSFLPLAGQVEGVFSYTYENDRYDFINERNPLFPRSYTRDANIFLPELHYGITDDVSVFANLGWSNNRTSESYAYEKLVFDKPAGQPYNPVNPLGRYLSFPPFRPFHFVRAQAHVDFHSLGAQNPVFGATWRVVDQARAPVNIDLTGSYTPDIFRAREAAVGRTGSIAAGGQSGTVQAAVSREMRILTLRAYAGFSYLGRRNVAAGLQDFSASPHAAYTAGVQSQLRVLPFGIAINAGVNAQQAVRYDRNESYSRFAFVSPYTIEPNGFLSPYAGLAFPILGNHLVGEVLYQHDFIDNQKSILYGDATRDFHQQANLYTARIFVAFGGKPASLPSPPIASPSNDSPEPAPARTYLVFFDWDRADLTTRARQIVAQAAEASARTQTTRIEVDGYTDLSGTALYNRRLSIRRAESVQSELVRDGVPQREIAIYGYGETNPLVQTAQGVREPQNRRVEIVLR